MQQNPEIAERFSDRPGEARRQSGFSRHRSHRRDDARMNRILFTRPAEGFDELPVPWK